MKVSILDTLLGSMMAMGDERALFLLEFVDTLKLDQAINKISKQKKQKIEKGWSHPLCSIQQELTEYFNGERTLFETPIQAVGTAFQMRVWDALLQIPFGQTRCYQQIAAAVGVPTACRAVANANGANPLAIIVPCHRVIEKRGGVGGYAGGIPRKKQLLELEKNESNQK